MKYLITTLTILLALSFNLGAQHTKQKIRGPIWITDDANTDVIGLSLAAYPKGIFQGWDTPMSRTFGVKLELSPLSPFFFLAPQSPLQSDSDKDFQNVLQGNPSEKIYGLNLETGNFVEKDIYGISLTAFLHYSRKNNGISLAGVSNTIERGNGLIMAFGGNGVYQANGAMIAFWGNSAHNFSGVQISAENYINGRGTGVQIGLFNKATNFRGIQLGLWNKNDKRSLPILNWQFSK